MTFPECKVEGQRLEGIQQKWLTALASSDGIYRKEELL